MAQSHASRSRDSVGESAVGLVNQDVSMARKTTTNPSRSLLFLFFCILVSGAVLGGMGIPLVSSEGMVIRAHLIEGDLPTTPEDAVWAKVAPMTLPLSGQVITRRSGRSRLPAH